MKMKIVMIVNVNWPASAQVQPFSGWPCAHPCTFLGLSFLTQKRGLATAKVPLLPLMVTLLWAAHENHPPRTWNQKIGARPDPSVLMAARAGQALLRWSMLGHVG